jgi:hypothetical protein
LFGGQQPIPVWGRSIFIPAVPHSANTLDVSCGGQRLRLNLGSG